MSYRIECESCQNQAPDHSWWLCPSCGSGLSVVYENQNGRVLFPLARTPAWERGVGGTPLVSVPELSRRLHTVMYAKCEHENPTGSFKDRGTMVELAKTKEYGKDAIVVASTGNMAVSLATFGKSRDIAVSIVVPKSTPKEKVETMNTCGAHVLLFDGSYDDCVGVAKEIAQKDDAFLCGDYVLRREGQKTIGWELARSGVIFDALVIPVGNGNVGAAIYQGLSEALEGSRLPAFIGIQPSVRNPLVRAWRENQPIIPQGGSEKTKAAGFDVGNPLDGKKILSLVRNTGGVLLDVTDGEMIAAQRELLAEGFSVELSAAATLAGFKKVAHEYAGQTVGLILTGAENGAHS
jgi:threonine synthase